MTQGKSDKQDAFSRRIEQLLSYAREKKIFRSRSALADFLGISRAMLYAYNDGSQEVSDAALAKLLQAEKRIRQIGEPPHVRVPMSGSESSEAQAMWRSRLKHLRERIGYSLSTMSERLRISEEWLTALENGSEPLPSSIISAVREMEELVAEAEYLNARPKPEKSSNEAKDFGKSTGSSVKLNPVFAPPVGNPTQQDCIDHLTAYLAEAKHVPGLVAHTLIELKKHFKISEARAQREDL